MIYAVMSAVEPKEINVGADSYKYIRFFDDKVEAIRYAKKLAKKEGGLPERFIFSLMNKTATPEPTEIEMVSVS